MMNEQWNRLQSKLSGCGKTTETENTRRARAPLQVVAAFDHYPPWESTALLDALWGAGIAAGPQGVSVQRLLALTDDAEEIERAAEARARQPGAGLEDLYDAMRTVRSRVRMYGKDGELYLSPPGDGDDGAGRQEQATFRWPWQQEEA
jgi:hypothetical protein